MGPEKLTKRQKEELRRIEKAKKQEQTNSSKRLRGMAIRGLVAAGIVVAGYLFISNSSHQEVKAVSTLPPVTSSTPLRDSLTPDLRGVKPAAGVDQSLIQQIVDLEAGYQRLDLSDTLTRTKHLELWAEGFAAYSGENLTKEQLINSIEFLSNEEYDRRFPDIKNSNASANIGLKKIFVRERPLDAAAAAMSFKGQMPYASALTLARFSYDHEAYHLAGIINNQEGQPSWPEKQLSRFYGVDVKLINMTGFSWNAKELATGNVRRDTDLEEIYAYYMMYQLEKKMFGDGYDVVDQATEQLSLNRVNRIVTGVKNTRALLKAKPEWTETFQRYHREKNVFGLGMFLMQQGKITPVTEEELQRQSVKIIMDLPDDSLEGDNLVKGYLQNLK